jgi:hypothetical protein
LGKDKYNSVVRHSLVDALVEDMFGAKIELEQAYKMTPKVVRFLVKKTALEKDGEYPGWAETVEREYSKKLKDIYEKSG